MPPASGSASLQWYAIRVTYNRELKVKEELDSLAVESFIPMQYTIRTIGGRRIKRLVPIIHNLIFIHVTPAWMKQYKASTKLPIRYIMDHETHRPIVIPEYQMQNFIAVAGTYDEQLIYLETPIEEFKKGEKVRITGGIFKGAEGTLLRIKGDRRLVVSIPGVVAVATAFIHPSLVEHLTPHS